MGSRFFLKASKMIFDQKNEGFLSSLQLMRKYLWCKILYFIYLKYFIVYLYQPRKKWGGGEEAETIFFNSIFKDRCILY